MTPEFSRRVALDSLPTAGRAMTIEADAAERAALARRFGLVAVESLSAHAIVSVIAGGAEARGTVRARIVQACVASHEPVAQVIDEPFVVRFADFATAGEEEERELQADDLDVMPLDGDALDLGEAVAQTVALAVDPFPRSAASDAGGGTWQAGPDVNPFAVLKGLVKD